MFRSAGVDVPFWVGCWGWVWPLGLEVGEDDSRREASCAGEGPEEVLER